MKTLALITNRLALLLTVCSLYSSYSQEVKTVQNPKFQELLKIKQSINYSLPIDDSYKIQLYYGDSDSAKKELLNFKRDFKDIEVTVIYTNPTYKVWAGNFKLRIYAEKALIDIKKKFPTAFILKANN